MEYKVVKVSGIGELVEKVNDLLKAGWIVQGGVSTDEYGYYQAMVRQS